MQWLADFWSFLIGGSSSSVTFLEILFIFLAKIIEVSIGTLRSILMNKGYRKPAVVLSLVEIFLWVFVASKVITGITEAPIRGIAYCLGFTTGIFLGSLLEAKIAFGKVLIQVITSNDKGPQIATYLRSNGCGVTIVDAQGKAEARKILMIYTNRRGSPTLIKDIQKMDANAMIINNEVGTLIGGHISPLKSLLK
jgi:uncharacterized protein YebE (UPF0316 family)